MPKSEHQVFGRSGSGVRKNMTIVGFRQVAEGVGFSRRGGLSGQPSKPAVIRDFTQKLLQSLPRMSPKGLPRYP